MHKYFNKFPHALRGLYHATKNDFGFRSQLYLIAVIAALTFIIFERLTLTEILFIILASLLILITELQNSALEAALDKLHPELNDQIKHSKDMAAASVLVAGLLLGIVIVVSGLTSVS